MCITKPTKWPHRQCKQLGDGNWGLVTNPWATNVYRTISCSRLWALSVLSLFSFLSDFKIKLGYNKIVVWIICYIWNLLWMSSKRIRHMLFQNMLCLSVLFQNCFEPKSALDLSPLPFLVKYINLWEMVIFDFNNFGHAFSYPTKR